MKGSLYKTNTKRGLRKGESSWRIILYLGRGADGKHRQKWVTFRGTKKQAEEKLTELTGEVHRGEFVEPSKLAFGDWLDQWVETAIKPPRRSPNTYESYRGIIAKHLKPALGSRLLQGLTSLHLERYYADCAATLSSSSIAVHHMIISGALRDAQRSGLLRQNMASRVTNKPRPKVVEDALHNVWTADEARAFLAYVKQHGTTQQVAMFALALDSGLRRGELLGLQWRDVDALTLRVERQLMYAQVGENPDIFALPKGRKPRSLDLSAETVALLAAHKREQAELKLKNRQQYAAELDLVFARTWEHRRRHHQLGAPLNVVTINSQLARLCKLANVRRISAHGLRHTCATLLLAAGTPPHVVQRRLGHAKVEITLNIYAHVLPNMQADAAAKLASVLHG